VFINQRAQEDVKNLHLVHSREAFKYIGGLLLKSWENAGEVEFSKWFRNELIVPPYNNWFIGCVNEMFEPLPHPDTTNPIESFNNTMKRFIPHPVSMSSFLNEKMPTILNHCLEDYCGVQFDTSISQAKYMAMNSIGRLILEKASKLVSMNNAMKIPNISQVKERSGEDAFFLNTKRNMVNVNSKASNNGDPVTPFRIKV